MAKHERFVLARRASRGGEVARLRRYLLQSSWPRLQMALLVMLTAGAGFVCSWLLLDLGLEAMAVRYALSVICAYAVFLGLLWLWMRSRLGDLVDLGEQVADGISGIRRGRVDPDAVRGSAGTPFEARDMATGSTLPQSGPDGFDTLGAVDEFVIPAVLVGVLLAFCAALVWAISSVVWGAPLLFAELLFDGVLAAGLYRRLRRADARHWLQSALRHTFWPFLAITAFCAVAGGLLQLHGTDATTLAEALHQAGWL